MNLNRRIKDTHFIPKMQFVTMDIVVINIHPVNNKVMVSVKDK
jgi:hypothetical protein